MGFSPWTFHKLSTFFEAVNYHTQKTKKAKQSAFHTDLVNMASFFYYESYIGLVVKWKVLSGCLV